jgi:hypothetical protein
MTIVAQGKGQVKLWKNLCKTLEIVDELIAQDELNPDRKYPIISLLDKVYNIVLNDNLVIEALEE